MLLKNADRIRLQILNAPRQKFSNITKTIVHGKSTVKDCDLRNNFKSKSALIDAKEID